MQAIFRCPKCQTIQKAVYPQSVPFHQWLWCDRCNEWVFVNDCRPNVDAVLADLKAERAAKFDPRTPKEQEADELYTDEQFTKSCNYPI